MIKVWVDGWFKKNLGDDLFLDILAKRYPNICFYYYSNLDYSYLNNSNKNLKQIKKFSISNIIRYFLNFICRKLKINKSFKVSDFVKTNYSVLISGSYFMEPENYSSLKFDFSIPINTSVPYYILGCNFGPYKTKKFYDKYFNIFKNAEDVCFRDTKSFDLFSKLDNVRISSDIVFNLDISNYKDIFEKERKVIISVINVNKNNNNLSQSKYNDEIIKLIKKFRLKDYNITLFSFSNYEGDNLIIDQIVEQVGFDVNKFYYDGDVEKALAEIASSEIVVGSRFHANILAAIFNKKFIPIAYSDKTIDVLNDLQYDGRIYDIRNDFSFEDFEIVDLKRINFNISEIANNNQQFKKLDILLKGGNDNV